MAVGTPLSEAIAKIKDLVRVALELSQVSWTGSASDLSSGTVPDGALPARLRAQLPVANDANLITDSGPYRVASAALNIPLAAAGYIVHLFYDSVTARQTYYRYNPSQAYERSMVAGIWGDWVRIYGQATDLNALYAQLAGPTTDKGQSIGGPLRRFANAYLSGTLTLGGAAEVTGPNLVLNAVAGVSRWLRWRTSDAERWLIGTDNVAETGANAGSNFRIRAHNDDGTLNVDAMVIARSTGIVTFGARPSVTGAGLVETQNNKGVAGGYPGLDTNGQVPSAHLPSKLASFEVWPGSFDGVTVDTAVANAFIARINAGEIQFVIVPRGTSLVGKLNSIVASDVTWIWLGKFKSVGNSLGEGQPLLAIAGNRSRHIGLLDIDGNAVAYSGFVACQLLDVTGDGHSFNAVKLHHSAGRGFTADGMTNFRFGSFTIEDNAGLGFQLARCAYGAIINNRVRRNGCGFGKTKVNAADVSHNFVGFGGAVRFRSHDIDFIGGDYMLNGKDGLNINQGSYNIKHIGVRGVANDDGGLTMAADNTGTGIPGEGEACFDITYIDCDTENNYSSGIVAYQPVHGLTVKGGKQKNNNRLAGDQAQATSFYNGVFVCSGSTGVDIDTSAYDDRQERLVSSVSGSGTSRTLAVAGWVPLSDRYPKVAIYSAGGVFRGYGKITGEATGSVTTQTTAQHGVTLSAITAGDIITQAVQHNGVLIENDVSARVRVKGNKPRVGPTPALQGQVTQITSSGNAGDVLLLDAAVGPNLMPNGNYDVDISGMTFNLPGGGTATRDTVNARSDGSLKLVGGSSPAEGDVAFPASAIKRINRSKWRWRGWAYSTVPQGVIIRVFTNTGPNVVFEWRSSGQGWEPFSVSGGFYDGNTLIARFVVAAGQTGNFDDCYFEPLDEVAMRPVASRGY